MKAQLASNASSTPNYPYSSLPSSPVKTEIKSEGSRDSSPTHSRPTKVFKIGEALEDSSELHVSFSPPLYDPATSATFDVKWYGAIISKAARGHVLLVDRSAQEVVLTLGCQWCQLDVSIDHNDACPSLIVNVVPDEGGS
jgi:hypothetical protein